MLRLPVVDRELLARRDVAQGVDLRALTAWSVFGAYDWSSILRAPTGTYEGGCFDTSGAGAPRRTPLADVVRATAAAGVATMPALGWWRRDDRVIYRPVDPADLAASA